MLSRIDLTSERGREVRNNLDAHFDRMRKERDLGDHNVQLARPRGGKSHEVLTICMDAAGPGCSYGSQYWPVNKSFKDGHLKLKAMGVQVHHYKFYLLCATKAHEHGANFMLECLTYVLKDLETLLEPHGGFPPRICVQLDNCSDNKAKAVLGYVVNVEERRRGVKRRKDPVCVLCITMCVLWVRKWY